MPLSGKAPEILAHSRPALLNISGDVTNIATKIWGYGIFQQAHMDIINNEVAHEDKMRLLITIYSQRANDLEPLKTALQELGYETDFEHGIVTKQASNSDSGMVKDIKARLQLMCENVRQVWGKLLNETSLEKCFVAPEIVREEKGEDGERKTGKSAGIYRELFQIETLDDRIVIEGDPGIGKTTYVNKIALDWTWDEGSEHYTDNSKFLQSTFTTIFLIPLRSLNGGRATTFSQAASVQLRDCGSWLNAKYQSNPSESLLILDAFDEYDGSCSEINEIIDGSRFPRLKVIITTRPSHLERLGVNNQWLSIIGLKTEEKWKEFLLNQGWDNLQNRDMIIHILSGLGSLWHTSLYLAMLCVLYKAKKVTGFEPQKPNSFYILFKLFTDHMLSRKGKEAQHVTKKGSQLKKEDRQKLKSHIQKCAIEQFSESNPWLVDALKTTETTSDFENLQELTGQFGLITIREEQSPITGETVEIVSFAHQMFLEYYAAVEFGLIFNNSSDKEGLVKMIKKNLDLAASPFSYFLASECLSYKEMLVNEQTGKCEVDSSPFQIRVNQFPWLPEIEISKDIIEILRKKDKPYIVFQCGFQNIKSFWDIDHVYQLCSIAQPNEVKIADAVLSYHNQTFDRILSSVIGLELYYCDCEHINLEMGKLYPNLTNLQFVNRSNSPALWIDGIDLFSRFPNLRKLSLGVNICHPGQVALLCKPLRNLNKLEELALNGCFIFGTGSSFLLPELANTIERSPLRYSLKKLDLSHNVLDGLICNTSQVLIKAISCVRLEVLCLSHCRMNIQTLEAMKDIFRNSTLCFSLRSFQIGGLRLNPPYPNEHLLVNKWIKDINSILMRCFISHSFSIKL